MTKHIPDFAAENMWTDRKIKEIFMNRASLLISLFLFKIMSIIRGRGRTLGR